MPRQSIVEKLNESEKFDLTQDEILFIVKNWVETHTQHKVDEVNIGLQIVDGAARKTIWASLIPRVDEIFVEVNLNKNSIVKS